jgi:hypothetical protein
MTMTHDEYYLAAQFSEAVAKQERRVLGLLLTERRLSTPIVQSAGLNVSHFEHDDHRLIFAGWLVACEMDLPLINMLRLIRRALIAAGWWDAAAQPNEGSVWHSDATLARLASTSLSKSDYLDSMTAVGWEGDWLAYAIARNVTALVMAKELTGSIQ